MVGVRISQTKVNDLVYRWSGGGDDVVVLAQVLAEAGASYLHVASEGRAWFDTALLADGSTVTGLAREVSGLPVIANGGMHEPGQAGRVLDRRSRGLPVHRPRGSRQPRPAAAARHGTGLADFDPAMLRPDVRLTTSNGWRQAG